MKIFLLLFLFISSLHAAPTSSPKLPVDIFLTSTCSHCQAAHDYFSSYQRTHPEVDIHFYWINQNEQSLKKFHNYLAQKGELDFSVPSFFFCNSHWTGFSPIIQQEIIKGIQTCRAQLQKAIPLEIISESLQQKMLLTTYFNTLLSISSVYIIPTMAILDAINPCSLFSIIAFFILMLLQKNTSDSLKIGAVWLAGMGAALIFNIQHPELLRFLLEGMFYRVVAALIGMLIFFYIYKIRFQTSGPTQLGIALLASFMINAYQQTCLLNLSKLFPMWATSPPTLTLITYILSIIAYAFFYLLIPICLYLVICYYKKRLQAPFLTYFNFIFLCFLGLILIIQPSALSSFSLSFVILTISLITSFIRSKWGRS